MINEPLSLDGFDLYVADLEDNGSSVFEIQAIREEPSDGEFSTRMYLSATSDSFRFVHQTRPFELESLVGRLNPGTTIGPLSPFSGDSTGDLYDCYAVPDEFTEYYTAWKAGTQAYLGFSFIGETTELRHFGWLELRIDPSGDEATIVQWAWESVGEKPILAGDVGSGPPPPPAFPVDQLSLQFDILRDDRENGVVWIVFPYISTTNNTWEGEITLESPTQTIAAYINHPEGVIASSSNFTSLAQMRAALTGTWALTAQVGTGDVVIEFDVNAAGVEESSFPLSSITSPARGAGVFGTEFSATWTQPSAGSWNGLRVLLSTVLRDDTPFPKYTNIANEELQPAQTSYHRTLDPGEKRLIVTYRNSAAGLPGLTVGTLRGESGDPPSIAWNILPATCQSRYETFFSMLDAPPPTDGFAIWAAGFFSPAQQADPAVGGPFGTPNGDGLANVAKYALGFSSPQAWETEKLPMLGLTPPAVPGGQVFPTLSFTLRNPLPGYTWRVEASQDLLTWRYNGDAAGTHFNITANDNPDGTTTFIARSLLPLGLDPAVMRLKFMAD